MFRHLLVPLDGSRLAEAALPAAAALARRLDARVTVLHVIERGAPTTVHGEPHLTQPTEAESYLKEVARWLSVRGVQADSLVDPDGEDVAGSIASRAGDLGADLAVLCTHGRSGLRALLFGRMAQQVLGRGTVPVLLVLPSPAGREQPFACRHLLVPLDGSEMAERGLPAATLIARAFGAEVLLMWVVPTAVTVSGERAAATKLMPTAAAALLDAEATQATSYLEEVKSRLQAEGVAVSATVGRGEPVRVLQETVTKEAMDLIVMATHGRAGAAAAWTGSIASRMLAHITRPILLIRIPESSARPD